MSERLTAVMRGRKAMAVAFPFDHLDPAEEILLDTNPTFARFIWPLLELLAITGVCWLAIGFMDNAVNEASDFSAARQLTVALWLILVCWRFGMPVLRWLGERLVITDRRILVRQGILRRRITSIDLASVGGIHRRGRTLVLRTIPYGQLFAIEDVPSCRKVAKMVNKMA